MTPPATHLAPAGDTGGHEAVTPARRTGIVATLAITQTIGYGTLYYAFAVLLTPLATDLHTSTTAVTGAFTASVLTGAALAVPIGRRLDRHGGRTRMTGGSAAGALLLVALSEVDRLWQLYLVQIGIGAAAAASLYEAAFAVAAGRACPVGGRGRPWRLEHRRQRGDHGMSRRAQEPLDT